MADIRRLPGPNADIWDWQRLGSCRGMDSAFFFHPDGERGPARAHRERRAKAVCRDCPVVEPCRRHAIAARRAVRHLGRHVGVRAGRDHHGAPAASHERLSRSRPHEHDGPHRGCGGARVHSGSRRSAPEVGSRATKDVTAPCAAASGRARGRGRGHRRGGGLLVRGLSTTALSVVSTMRAMEAAFSTAERVTLTGSMIPVAMRSP